MEPLKLVTNNDASTINFSNFKYSLDGKLGQMDVFRLIDAAGVKPKSVDVTQYKNAVEIKCFLEDTSIVKIIATTDELTLEDMPQPKLKWTWYDTKWFAIGVLALSALALFLTR
jgi:hypothetical protein